jgi:5-methylcytosine-specific restriction protein A
VALDSARSSKRPTMSEDIPATSAGPERRTLKRLPRSSEMKLVGYSLSRCGVAGPTPNSMLPPPWLGTSVWNSAYDQFFHALAEGRDPEALRATLKNVRDSFDAHVKNGRRGWIKANGQPVRKDTGVQEILDAWSGRPDQDLINAVLAIRDGAVTEPDPEMQEGMRRTEGGKKVYISWRYERDRANREDAVRIHGAVCMGCRFSFEAAYGSAGAGYIEVHHAMPIAEYGVRETDPVTDLQVLCANCHRIVHRKHDVCLSLEALRVLVDNGRKRVGLAPLWRPSCPEST